MTIAHYDPAEDKDKTEEQQAARCLSCGSCRDCHLCETMCPIHSISREELPAEEAADGVTYRYVSDDSKCIACGIWTMRCFLASCPKPGELCLSISGIGSSGRRFCEERKQRDGTLSRDGDEVYH